MLLRDRRDELHGRWIVELKDTVGAEYVDVLASPLGVRLVRHVVDDLIALSQAEAYEVPGIIRRIESETAADAARRGALGFDLMDVIAGVQQVRAAIWKVLIDALVVGDLPAFGETMDEMQQIDAFIDLLVRVEVRGFLEGQSRPPAAENDPSASTQRTPAGATLGARPGLALAVRLDGVRVEDLVEPASHAPGQALEVVQDVGVRLLERGDRDRRLSGPLGRRRQLALMPDHDRAVELEKRRGAVQRHGRVAGQDEVRERLVGGVGGVLAHTKLGVDHRDGVEHQYGHDDDDHGERDHPTEKTILSLPAGVAHPVPPVCRRLCHHESLPVSA